MRFNLLSHTYPSTRNVVCAHNGMVATTHPYASQAGLEILKKGGNAVDAAVATAVALTVIEPTSNGIGGDLFALIWKSNTLYGLNGSGFSPSAHSFAFLEHSKTGTMPAYGWLPVTVPGAPKAWFALSQRFGRCDFKTLFEPAIEYAENGVPVQPTIGRNWAAAFEKYRNVLKDSIYKEWFTTFAPSGRAPYIGELFRSKAHADSLRCIAQSDADEFYTGSLAEAFVSFSNTTGGVLTANDLSEYTVEWVEPLCVSYKGYDIWELPPNGHGIAALMALNTLKNDAFDSPDSLQTVHLQIEAMKQSFADAFTFVSDPRFMRVSPEDMLADAYAMECRKKIGDEAALPRCGHPEKGGTVYCAAADRDGTMVSLIQSNYMGFGSGLVIPGTGIALHNRGHNFCLDPDHPNCIGPRKRPYHTIIPGFITKDRSAIGPFGVMGGYMQPQGHLQVVMNMIDFGMNPQEALDHCRWMWKKDRSVHFEQGYPSSMLHALSQKGHVIHIATGSEAFGRGQIIVRSEHGTYIGGTERRADGYIACW